MEFWWSLFWVVFVWGWWDWFLEYYLLWREEVFGVGWKCFFEFLVGVCYFFLFEVSCIYGLDVK